MDTTRKHAIVIGSGFGGVGVAALLAKAGYQVDVYEKNESFGGRASVFSSDGFRFDMGPSWYLMPDVFERFFALLGERVEDHITLKRLSPSYRIFFKDKQKTIDLFSDIQKDAETFASLEAGAGDALKRYLQEAKEKYEIGVGKFVYKNYDHVTDFFTKELLLKGPKLSVFSSMHRYVSRFFKNPDVQKLVQHNLLFLGNSPYNAPALYSMLSHVDLTQGVFYPMGGIGTVISAIVRIAEKHGATFHAHRPVKRILVTQNRAYGVEFEDGEIVEGDLIISNADRHYTDTHLLPETHASSEQAWKKRVTAPSAFLLYLGTNKKFPSITHHNLVFSQDWKKNFAEIFDTPKLPEDPSFYVCAPSVTDPDVAPKGQENLFVLVPVASGLFSSEPDLDAYEASILTTMETVLGMEGLRKSIVFKRRFTSHDFQERYHSYRGTGLGLSHTLLQTALFRPNNIHPNIKDLYYVGADTNPGIGMPMCLISAQLVYKRLVGDTGHTSPTLP